MNTILLIDDDEAIRTLFSTALQTSGYRVIEAASGDAGFALAKQQLPDLILSDIFMAHGDGQALLKRIRQDPELASRQVVLMTGHAETVTPRTGMEEGADDFLVKPVTLDALLRCVDARLKRAQVNWRVEDRLLSQLRASLHSTLPNQFFTPLGGIIGLTDILQTNLRTLSSDEVGEVLRDLHNTALRLHRTLRNYMMILGLPSGNQESARPLALLPAKEAKESIRSGVQASMRRTRRDEDLTIVGDGHAVWGTPLDLSLIAEELVDNACNYSARGTPVRVEFDGAGMLTITDEGRGMTAEEIEKTRAFQTVDQGKRELHGLGLGLAVVQKLAAKCGAKVSIESRSEAGTQVRIAFRTEASPGRPA